MQDRFLVLLLVGASTSETFAPTIESIRAVERRQHNVEAP